MRISGRTLAAGLATVVTAGLTTAVTATAATADDRTDPPRAAAASWQRAGQWSVGREGVEVTGIDLDPAGRLVVARDNRRVATYGRSGKLLSSFEAPIRPGRLDVAADGDLHLMPDERAVRAVRSMRVLGPKGRLKRTYGNGRLPEAGGFEVGAGLRRVAFADTVGVQVAIYDVATGQQLDRWGEDGTEGSDDPNALDFPADLALMPDDRVLVDSGSGELRVFRLDGRYQRSMGRRQLDDVAAVAYGGGRAFGLESRTPQVEVFSAADGRHQRTLRAGLSRTVDLAASRDGDTLYVAGRLPSGEPGVTRFVRR